MATLNYILLMMGSGEGGEGDSTQMFIMMGLIIVVFYFFMIRPQVKRQKETKKFREELEKGDKVLTSGGIHGKIAEIDAESDFVMLDVGNNTKLKVSKLVIIKDASELAMQKK